MKRLPLVVRLILLPTTSLVDTVLLPKNVDKEFHNEARYFLGGFHVVCWLRLLFIPTLMLMLTMFETCIQEAALIANQLYQKQKSFTTKQIIDEWNKGSFTYDALNFEICLFTFLVWLIAVNVLRKSYSFILMHWFGLFVLIRFIAHNFH
ncbi:hypothetical protein M3Y97_00439400 [Aphelenchoides bicaudatus]|nr:hypothetical protein M3Y97_00439400 [Aphelenchoides bicaudatus]